MGFRLPGLCVLVYYNISIVGPFNLIPSVNIKDPLICGFLMQVRIGNDSGLDCINAPRRYSIFNLGSVQPKYGILG